MKSACRKSCLQVIKLSEQLLKIVNHAHSDCDDDHCLVLFGIDIDPASNSKLPSEAEKPLTQIEAEGSFEKLFRWARLHWIFAWSL